jgi:hypothetical protein
MVLLSGNFPRTFPFQSESRRGGNPNGFLTHAQEVSPMRKLVVTLPSIHQKSRIESPQSTILSGHFALGGAL